MNITAYQAAIELSERAHRGQIRKGTKLEYFTHPLAVSSMVMGYGGSYSQAIGGLCHDILEDCGAHYRKEIGAIDPVALIIAQDASDCIKGEGPKASWHQRKLNYLTNFRNKDPRSYLVICCDKIHNSGDTLRESEIIGYAALQKFRAEPELVLWYFVTLACELTYAAEIGHMPMAAAAQLRNNVFRMLEIYEKEHCWAWGSFDDRSTKVYDALRGQLLFSTPFVCDLD